MDWVRREKKDEKKEKRVDERHQYTFLGWKADQ